MLCSIPPSVFWMCLLFMHHERYCHWWLPSIKGQSKHDLKTEMETQSADFCNLLSFNWQLGISFYESHLSFDILLTNSIVEVVHAIPAFYVISAFSSLHAVAVQEGPCIAHPNTLIFADEIETCNFLDQENVFTESCMEEGTSLLSCCYFPQDVEQGGGQSGNLWNNFLYFKKSLSGWAWTIFSTSLCTLASSTSSPEFTLLSVIRRKRLGGKRGSSACWFPFCLLKFVY